jgi:hypothetical protein
MDGRPPALVREPRMKRIEILLAPTQRRTAYDYERYADLVVDTYPMLEWLWDPQASDDSRRCWIFYADDPLSVRSFFDRTSRERGFAVSGWQVSDVASGEERAIRSRLR